MTKLSAPQGFGNVSFNGEEFVVGKNGVVEVPSEAVEALKPFGFEVFIEPESEKKPKKSKDE